MSQIEITDVERLALRPGDALVVRVPHMVTPATAKLIIERVRAVLELDETTPVLVLDGNMSVEVVGRPPGMTAGQDAAWREVVALGEELGT